MLNGQLIIPISGILAYSNGPFTWNPFVRLRSTLNAIWIVLVTEEASQLRQKIRCRR